MLDVMTSRTWNIAAARLRGRIEGFRMSAANVPVRMQVNGRSIDVEHPAASHAARCLARRCPAHRHERVLSEGECGACTVLVNGQAVCSCLVLAVEMDGQHVTTIEGIASDGQLRPFSGGVRRERRRPVRLLHSRA